MPEGVFDTAIGHGVVVNEVHADLVDLVGLQLDLVDVLGAVSVVNPDELAFVPNNTVIGNGIQNVVGRRSVDGEGGAVLGNFAESDTSDVGGRGSFVFVAAAGANAEHQTKGDQQGGDTAVFHKLIS